WTSTAAGTMERAGGVDSQARAQAVFAPPADPPAGGPPAVVAEHRRSDEHGRERRRQVGEREEVRGGEDGAQHAHRQRHKQRVELLVACRSRMPAALENFPADLDPAKFNDPKSGWGNAAENAAVGDLDRALQLKTGKGDNPDAFDCKAHLLLARIWA